MCASVHLLFYNIQSKIENTVFLRVFKVITEVPRNNLIKKKRLRYNCVPRNIYCLLYEDYTIIQKMCSLHSQFTFK